MAVVSRVEGPVRLAARTSSSAAACSSCVRESQSPEMGETDLCLGVVLCLLLTPDDGPALVGVYEVRLVVADDAGGAGVDQCRHTGLLAGFDDGLGAVDVDLFEQGVGDPVVALGGRRGGVDDDVGLHVLEDGGQLVGVGNVGLEVLEAVGLGAAVAHAAQVEGRDGAVVVVQEHVDHMVAQKAAAADHEYPAQVGLLF
jgi:hypothetical protein